MFKFVLEDRLILEITNILIITNFCFGSSCLCVFCFNVFSQVLRDRENYRWHYHAQTDSLTDRQQEAGECVSAFS